MLGDSVALVAGTTVIGLANYGLVLALVWLLPPGQFSELASTNSIVLVLVAAANAALPWVVTRAVARSGPGEGGRVRAVTTSLRAASVLGVAGALVVAGLTHPYDPAALQAAAALTVVLVFVSQVGVGHLQGQGRFRRLAGLLVLEALVRVGLGAALALRWGAAGALAGTAVAAGLLVATTGWPARRDLVLRLRDRSSAAYPWGEMRGIAGVQIGVAALSALDVVVGSIIHGASEGMAGYQAMLVFTRAPLFLTGAISAVVYTRLVERPGGQERDGLVGRAVLGYATLAVPLAAVLATVPAAVISLVLPARYVGSISLLLPLAVAGTACGWVNIVTTFFQAESRFVFPTATLWLALPVLAAVESAVGGSLHDLAWTAAAGDATLALVLILAASRRYVRARLRRSAVTAAAATAAGLALLRVARPSPGAWVPAALALTVAALAGGTGRHRITLRHEAARRGALP